MNKKINFYKLAWQEKILLILWTLVFVLHAFPVFKLGDFRVDRLSFVVFTVFASFFFSKDFLPSLRNTPLKYFFGFVAVVFVVNSLQNGFEVNFSNSVLYAGLAMFSFASFLCLSKYFDLFIKWMIIGSFIGLFISCIDSLYDTHYSARAFFKNTNQFARFGLFFSVICSLLVFRKKWDFNDFIFGAVIGMGLFSAIAPVRRAAILGWIILVLFILIYKWKIMIPATIVCISFLCLFYFLSPYNFDSHLAKIENRISPEFQEDGNYLVHRGYDVILKYPEEMIFGAGEANMNRFPIDGKTPKSIHSTFLNILFCYGLLGFGLYVLYLIRMIDFRKKRSLLFLPIFVHILFHNDIRNIYLLIFPILFYLTSDKVTQKLESPLPSTN